MKIHSFVSFAKYLFGIFSLLMGMGVHSQEMYYYYYKGEKNYLTLDRSRFNITATPDFRQLNISNLLPFDFDWKESKETPDQLFGSIQLYVMPSEAEYNQIISALESCEEVMGVHPSYISSPTGRIGMSSYFTVKLKALADTTVLQQYASQKHVTIVQQNKYMPLWYTLQCTKEADENTLLTANAFQESGLFDSASPSFLSITFPLSFEYNIHLRVGLKWKVGRYDSSHIVSDYTTYEVKGDSIIGLKRYYKLYCNNDLLGLMRNDEGTIYLRIFSKAVFPDELSDFSRKGVLDEDFLLYTFAHKWELDSCFLYSQNYASEIVTDTIRIHFLDKIQLSDGKFYKVYKNFVYGLGDIRKGPLGVLMPHDRGHQGGFCLVELYDGDELLFRTTDYTISGLVRTQETPDIRLLYSPGDKMLVLDSSLSEESYTVELFRIDGTKARSFSASSCCLSDLPPGIYLVRVTATNAGLYTAKIRVE